MSPDRKHPPLAVVIPAYRARFLGEAVASIAAQTNRSFNLYIGDDASKEDLLPVARSAAGTLPFEYTRFDSNLGGTDLVGHWERCVALTRDEPWIWIFSDDDVAPPDAVEAFLAEISGPNPPTDLYRFDLRVIDASGNTVLEPHPHPPGDSPASLVYALLSDRRRQWRMADHVFSRTIHARADGFVNFPKALYADFATWIRFSHPRGVRTLRAGPVLWRTHASGTSSGQRGANRAALFDCLGRFMAWTRAFAVTELGMPEAEVRALTLAYFLREIRLSYPPLDTSEIRSLSKVAGQVFGGSIPLHAARLCAVSVQTRIRHWPLFYSLARWRYKRSLRRQ